MYGIKRIAELTGVSPITLRAWENRYGVILPDRTDGGTRVYTDNHLEDLQWVIKQKNDNHLSIGQAMMALEQKRKTTKKAQVSSADYPRFIDGLFLLLKHHQLDEASAYVEELKELIDIDCLFHHIFIPILTRIGEEWEKGVLSVADEHYMSHFIQQQIAHYFYHYDVKVKRATAIAVCPVDEMHQIGLLLFSIFLKQHGIDVLFIGEKTPLDDIKALIEDHDISLAAFSLTTSNELDAIIDFIDLLKQDFPDLILAIGGQQTSALPERFRDNIISHDPVDWAAWVMNTMA